MRGRKPITGACVTREELCREVHWFYLNTSMSIEAIGRRFGVSQGTALRAMADEEKRRTTLATTGGTTP